MDNAFRMLSDLVSNLTSVIIGILGLGIVGSLAFGDMMGLDVIGNITSLVESSPVSRQPRSAKVSQAHVWLGYLT